MTFYFIGGTVGSFLVHIYRGYLGGQEFVSLELHLKQLQL